MPNRIIKESICTSDDINRLSWFEEVLFYRLIVACDDYGRYDGRAAIIKNRLFPLKEKLTAAQVTTAIDKLAGVGLVALYEHEGKPYLYLPTWSNHQTPRAKNSKFPDPEQCVKSSASICKQMQADVHDMRDTIIDNRYTICESGKAHPTVEEVKEYCDERGNEIDPQHFVDYYTQQGWKLSNGNSMKDWKAAIRNWERRDAKKPKGKPSNYWGESPKASAVKSAYQSLLEEETA